ncbi:MAG: site-specific DNA-methyltransferase [Ruminococcus sp.]|nr:site-specific DNA-methyltransferase [Ruminococcus sp.]
MQAAVQAKMPRNQAVFGSFWAYGRYVDCIKDNVQIDPPYNTGSDAFVYDDAFNVDLSKEEGRTDYRDEEGNIIWSEKRFKDNPASNGRFHTDWLNMLYPRLRIAKDLLTDDGVIFISIDDNEVENLIKCCNEVFGVTNRVGEIIWQSATDNNPRQITIEHEYVLCYAKNKSNLQPWQIPSEKARIIEDQYKLLKATYGDTDTIQQELRNWIKLHQTELQGVTHYNNVDKKGVYSNSSNSSNTKPGGYMFDIIHPITKKPCVKPAYGWRWAEKTFWDYDRVGDIEWGKDETTQPHVKKRIDTVTELLKSIYYEDGRVSTKQIESLFGKKKIFDNPKTMGLIERLVRFSAKENDAVILDFFSGLCHNRPCSHAAQCRGWRASQVYHGSAAGGVRRKERSVQGGL